MPDASSLSVAVVTPVAHRSDVLARLSADSSVLKAMGLACCGVFGSFARDQAIRPDSDVDLLVSFQAGRKDYDAYLGTPEKARSIAAQLVSAIESR